MIEQTEIKEERETERMREERIGCGRKKQRIYVEGVKEQKDLGIARKLLIFREKVAVFYIIE